MADVFDFYVLDNRKITFQIAEPIMQEDCGVTDFVFHIPKSINGLDMSAWAWWFIFTNAKKEKYSVSLTLSDDPERPLDYNIATYTVDYAMSIKAGAVHFALEAINTGTGGAINNEWHTLTYETKVKETLQGNQAEYAETESDVISALIQTVREKVNQLVDVDSVPTEGSTNAVSSGGVWDAVHDTDVTLTEPGAMADAKATGDAINELKVYLGSVESLTWAERMAYVRAGKGADIFPVGTQFRTQHGTLGPILWDVVAHDHFANPNDLSAHTMTLMTHYSISDDHIRYSINDVFYYAENGLATGNYSFTVANRANATGGLDNGLTFYFTLQNDIPAGGQIRKQNLKYNTRYADENSLAVYSDWEATEPSEYITPTSTPITGATSLGTQGTGNLLDGGLVDNAGPDYDISAIRKWLNSDESIGEWFTPSTGFDRVGYINGDEPETKLHDFTTEYAGFMHGLDSGFLNYVGEIDYPCVSGARVSLSRELLAEFTLRDKFTLPSLTEVGLAYGTDTLTCGRCLEYFENANNEQRIKYRSATLSANRAWITRQPATTTRAGTYVVRGVSTSGTATNIGGTSNQNLVIMCTLY